MKPIDLYFLEKDEPVKGCLQSLRSYLLSLDEAVAEGWRYSMPFYFYNEKRFCYLWIDKKSKIPYIGFVDGNELKHSDLIADKRSRMKILLIDPKKDIPVRKINLIMKEVLSLYK